MIGLLWHIYINGNNYQKQNLVSWFHCLFSTSVFVSSETTTTEQSDKFSSVRETAKQIQTAQEEEEDEDEDEEGDKIKETTEENSWGSNWERVRVRGVNIRREEEWRCFVTWLESKVVDVWRRVSKDLCTTSPLKIER